MRTEQLEGQVTTNEPRETVDEQQLERSDESGEIRHADAPRGKILVVDDEDGARQALVALLRDDGHDVRDASDGFKAVGILRNWEPDILLTDIRMPLMDGLDLLKQAKQIQPELVAIVMTAFGTIDTAVEAMKTGADDFLTKPLNFDAVELIIDRAMKRLEMMKELKELKEERVERERTRIIGNSAPLKECLKVADQVAPSRATILITGESGTGKELIARRIHDESNRANSPFLTLHCAALPETLLESELFGHEKGAFTGASSTRRGRFEEADGGTLFLDEIGEISPATQVKLLRFLQTREFERVGGNKTYSVDVRILAATNRELAEEVKSGAFREDLYYRLNVINIETPPLRGRRSDVPVLARHFVAKYAAENGKDIKDIDAEAMQMLEGWDWPGNVRELENIIERAVVLCDSSVITRDHLPREVKGVFGGTLSPELRIPGSTLADLEKYAILETYRATGGNTRETADTLQISQRKVQYKLNEYREEDGVDI
jgi:DNA-binding NtrC family response regulator